MMGFLISCIDFAFHEQHVHVIREGGSKRVDLCTSRPGRAGQAARWRAGEGVSNDESAENNVSGAILFLVYTFPVPDPTCSANPAN